MRGLTFNRIGTRYVDRTARGSGTPLDDQFKQWLSQSRFGNTLAFAQPAVDKDH
jgi:hypothetical protein